MSTKVSIYYDQGSGVHLYEEVTLGDIQSPAYLTADNPEECSLQHDINGTHVMLCVSAATMDAIAIAWRRHRNMQGALGGAVGREFGGPDCEYS